MANKPNNNNGKGRVVTPAPNGANGKSAKTAGVRTRRKDHGKVLATMRATAGTAGHKLPYQCATLDDALTLADTLPTLRSAGLWDGVSDMGKRNKPRIEWALSIGAPFVPFHAVIHENKGGEITHRRPSNTVRVRIEKRGEYAYQRRDYYYAIPYGDGSFIVRKGERKSN